MNLFYLFTVANIIAECGKEILRYNRFMITLYGRIIKYINEMLCYIPQYL